MYVAVLRDTHLVKTGLTVWILMNVILLMEDAATFVPTPWDLLNVPVLRDTCLEKTSLTVLISTNVILLMEDVATFVPTPWDRLNAVAI